MGATSRERYAVVSCHVERPLDDAVWSRFSALQQRRPRGFRVGALMRPADESAGEDEARWLERAREAARRGPLGHHTHWTSPSHARPTGEGTGERVLAEGARLRELGLKPTLFCGGGWYTDVSVAEACAELGYVDCTPRGSRPPYLASGERWASLPAPARVLLPSGRPLPAIPTTHSLGELGRALLSRRSLPQIVHVYFHDTELRDRRRRSLLWILLRVLARRTRPSDLDSLARDLTAAAPEVAWAAIARDS
jgi:hypothetical protein